MTLVRGGEEKTAIIDQFKTHASDTGSPEVQIAILTKRIEGLSKHFDAHVKDNGSRRGLLKMVSQRRTLLGYLKQVDAKRYAVILDKLNLRK